MSINDDYATNAYVMNSFGKIINDATTSVEEFVQKSMLADPDVRSTMIKTVFDQVTKKIQSKSKLHKFYSKIQLSAKQQSLINESYYDIDVDFSKAHETPPHAFAHLSRLLAYSVCYNILGILGKKTTTAYNRLVKDFGASGLYHLMHNDSSIHCCIGIFDINDSIRYSQMHHILANPDSDYYTEDRASLVRQYKANDPEVVCYDGIAKCNVTAPYAIMIDSVYDISFDDLLEALIRSRTQVCAGCFVYDSCVLVSDYGVIPELEMRFVKFNKCGQIYIKFFFENDYGTVYTHKWTNYLRLLTTFVLSRDGNHYSYQLVQHRCGYMYFKIMRLLTSVTPSCVVDRVLTINTNDDMIVLYTWNYSTTNSLFVDKMVPKRIVVSTVLVELIKSFGYSLTDGRRTISNLLIAANSFNNRKIINGKDVHPVKPLSADDLYSVVVAIYIHLYITNWEQTKCMAKILKDENKVRKYGSKLCIFSRISHLICERFSTSKQHLFDKIHPSLSSNTDIKLHEEEQRKSFSFVGDLLSKIGSIIHVSRKYNVVFQDVCKFYSITEEIEMLLSAKPIVGLTDLYHTENSSFNDIDKKILESAILDSLPKDSTAYDFSSFAISSCNDDISLVANPVAELCVYHALRAAGITTLSPSEIISQFETSPFLDYLKNKDTVLAYLQSPPLDIFIIVASHFDICVCVHTKGKCYRFGKGRVYHFHEDRNHISAYITSSDHPQILQASDYNTIPDGTYDLSDAVRELTYNDRVRFGSIKSILYNLHISCVQELLNADETLSLNNDFRNLYRTFFPQNVVGAGGFVCRSALKTKEIFERFNVCTTNGIAISIGAPGGEVHELINRNFKKIYGITLAGAVPWAHDILVHPTFTEIYGPMHDGDITQSIFRRYLYDRFSRDRIDFIGCDACSDSCFDEILYAQAEICIKLSHYDTLCYVKINKFSHSVVAVLHRLTKFFSSVRVVRLSTTRPFAHEHHIVLTGRSDCTQDDDYNVWYCRYVDFMNNVLSERDACFSEFSIALRSYMTNRADVVTADPHILRKFCNTGCTLSQKPGVLKTKPLIPIFVLDTFKSKSDVSFPIIHTDAVVLSRKSTKSHASSSRILTIATTVPHIPAHKSVQSPGKIVYNHSVFEKSLYPVLVYASYEHCTQFLADNDLPFTLDKDMPFEIRSINLQEYVFIYKSIAKVLDSQEFKRAFKGKHFKTTHAISPTLKDPTKHDSIVHCGYSIDIHTTKRKETIKINTPVSNSDNTITSVYPDDSTSSDTDIVLKTFREIYSQLTTDGLHSLELPEGYVIVFDDGVIYPNDKHYDLKYFFDVATRSCNVIDDCTSYAGAGFDITTKDGAFCRGVLMYGSVRDCVNVISKVIGPNSSFCFDNDSIVYVPKTTSFDVSRIDVEYHVLEDALTTKAHYYHYDDDYDVQDILDFADKNGYVKIYLISCTLSRSLVKNLLHDIIDIRSSSLRVCIVCDYEMEGLTNELPLDVSSTDYNIQDHCSVHTLFTAEYRCQYCKIIPFCNMMCATGSDHYKVCSTNHHNIIASRTDSTYIYYCDPGDFDNNILSKIVVCVFDTSENPMYSIQTLNKIDPSCDISVPTGKLHLHYHDKYFVLLVKGFTRGVFDPALLLSNMQEFFTLKPEYKKCTIYISKALNHLVDVTMLRLMDLPCSVAIDDDRVKTLLPTPYVKQENFMTDQQKKHAVAAAKECLIYCENSSLAISRSAANIYKLCLTRSVDYIISNNVDRAKFAVIDLKGKVMACNYVGYVTPLKVYSNSGVINFREATEKDLLKFTIGGHVVMGFLVTPEMKVAFEYILPTILRPVSLYFDFTYQVIQAAPGCGKSTNVVNIIDPEDLALVYTTSGCADLTARLKLRLQTKRTMIYTVASILINQPSISVNTLWIDEARMNNPGMLFYAISILRPKHVVFLGDGLQIPFVNTISSMNMVYSDLYKILPITDVWNVSYRITTSVCSLLQPYYSDYCKHLPNYRDLTTTNPTNGEMKFHKINAISQVPYRPNTIYLTFTQEEKLKLADHHATKLEAGRNLFTVHEFQGNQCENVIAFRSNLFSSTDIFKRQEYGIVMMSRHTKSFEYYSFLEQIESNNDFVANHMLKLKNTDMRVKKGDLHKYQFKTLRGLDEFSVVSQSFHVRTPVDYRDYKSASKRDIKAAALYITASNVPNTRRVFSLWKNSDTMYSLRELTLALKTYVGLEGTIVFDLCDKYTPSYFYNLLYKTFCNCTIRVSAKSAALFTLAPYQIYDALIMNGIFDKPVFECTEERVVDEAQVSSSELVSFARVPFNMLFGSVLMYGYSHKFISYIARRSTTTIANVVNTLSCTGKFTSTNLRLTVYNYSLDTISSLLKDDHVCFVVNCQLFPYDEYKMLYNVCKTTSSSVHFTDYPDFTNVSDAPISEIQDVLIEFYGHQCVVNNDYDTYQVNTQDIVIDCGQPVVINNVRGLYTYKPTNTLRSKICSPVSESRPHTSIEALLAFAKRNCAVPDLGGVIDSDAMADVLYKNLMLCLKRDAVLDGRNEVGPCSYYIAEWLKTQKFNLDQLVGETCLELVDVSSFEFGIKPSVKVNVEYTSTQAYSSLQTIVFHQKSINAIFCQIWGFIRKYFLNNTKPQFQMFCDLNMDEFSTILTNRDTELCYFDKCQRVDIDISMYDKSQALSCLKLECLILKRFGVDERLINIWFNAHYITTIRDTITGLKSVVYTQRKSGDSATFIGNTMFLMAVMTTVIPHDYIRFSLFSGDDSVIWFDKFYDVPSEQFSRMFNLTAKMTKYDTTYFCSKFIVRNGAKLVCIPDPMKFFVKLGRKDIISYTHLEEYRRSLYDLLKNYVDYGVCNAVAEAVRHKYGITTDLTSLLNRIPAMLSSSVFQQFFYLPEGVVLDENALYGKM